MEIIIIILCSLLGIGLIGFWINQTNKPNETVNLNKGETIETIKTIKSNTKMSDIFKTYNIICEGINYEVKLIQGIRFCGDEIHVNGVNCTSVWMNRLTGTYASRESLESWIADAIEEYHKYLKAKESLLSFKGGELKSKKVLEEERKNRYEEMTNKFLNLNK